MKKIVLIVGAAIFLVSSIGCGGSDRQARPDARPMADALPTIDGTAACTVPPTGFGDLGTVDMGEAQIFPLDDTMPNGQQVVAFGVLLDMTATPDQFVIQLYEGFGVFPGVFADETYPLVVPITGDAASFASCGACAIIFGDIPMAGNPDRYQAISGTMTIDVLDGQVGGQLTGSVTNLVFEHVGFSNPWAPLNDGCTTSVDAFAFDLPIIAAP